MLQQNFDSKNLITLLLYLLFHTKLLICSSLISKKPCLLMLRKDEILKLLVQNEYADFFDALDSYDLDTPEYNRLKKEFVGGKTDIDYNNRCKVLMNQFFKEKENKENKDWLVVKTNPTKTMLLHFLEIYPKGKYTLEAELKLRIAEQQQKEAEKWLEKGNETDNNLLKINFYTKAIELGYEPLQNAYYIRGDAKDSLQDYEGAIQDYDQAISLQPDFAIAYHNRGFAKYNSAENSENPIQDYDQAISLQPDFAIAYNNRGIAKYHLQDDNEGAIDDYTQAIYLKPDFADAYHNRGLAKYYLQDYKGAIQDYNQAIDLESDAITYNHRGQVHYLLGNYQAAIADWKKMLKNADEYYEPSFDYIDEARKKVK
jgi:tetratricopeptide (TPR) repeat protein